MDGKSLKIRERVKVLGKVLNKALNENYPEQCWYLLLYDYVKWGISKLPLKNVEDDFVWHNKKQEFQILEEFKSNYDKLKYGSVEKAIVRGNNLFINFSRFNDIKLSNGDIILPYKYRLRTKNASLNTELRRKIIKSIDSKSITTIQLIQFLPFNYLENLKKILNSMPTHRPQDKIFHVLNWPSEYYKFLLFKYKSAGSYIIGYQHGAMYGEVKDYHLYKRDKAMSDEFRTWGWKLEDGDKPWMSHRLNFFKSGYKKEKGSKKHDYIVPLNYQDRNILKMGGFQAVKKELNKCIWDKLEFRARPVNFFWSNKKFLQSHLDMGLDIHESKTPFNKVLKRSNMAIIFSVPSSTLLECITVDHPVCALLSRNEPLTGLAEDKYNGLVELKILHKSIESLTNHLNEIGDEINDWWLDATESKEYNEFKSTFCQTKLNQNV